jgi:3-hydroxybutyryl-CoA dehydrogenase
MVWEKVASPEDVDKSLKFGYNLPAGPLELGDQLGSWGRRVEMEADKVKELGEKGRVHPLIKTMVRAGYPGGPGKKGIYDFWKEVLSKW